MGTSPLPLSDRAGLRDADRPWPRGGTRPRHRPSQSQAGEHLHHARRAGEASRFRLGHGTAREPGDEATRLARTEAGVVLGTADYMSPDSIEVLLTRAEIETFAGAPDAPDHVGSLLGRAADGLFHTAPYPVKLAHAYHLHRRGATTEAGRILEEILANRKDLADGADWPMVFMQNAAVYALKGQPVAALDELDRAYAAGWRDGRTLAIDPFFTSVRAEPRFTQLLSRIQSDVAAMRARADYSGLPSGQPALHVSPTEAIALAEIFCLARPALSCHGAQ